MIAHARALPMVLGRYEAGESAWCLCFFNIVIYPPGQTLETVIGDREKTRFLFKLPLPAFRACSFTNHATLPLWGSKLVCRPSQTLTSVSTDGPERWQCRRGWWSVAFWRLGRWLQERLVWIIFILREVFKGRPRALMPGTHGYKHSLANADHVLIWG